jgi:hypothetical protein
LADPIRTRCAALTLAVAAGCTLTPPVTADRFACGEGGACALTIEVEGRGQVTSDDGQINCSAPSDPGCSANYPIGSLVALHAVVPAGGGFETWSDACDSAGNATRCVVTISGEAHVGASFAWSPRELVGLVLWLVAKDATPHAAGGRIGRWNDRSGRGNDALAAAIGPARTATVGGQPALHFDGTGWLEIADAASLQWGTHDFAIEAVVRYTQTASGSALFVKADPAPPTAGPELLLGGAVTAEIESGGAFLVQTRGATYGDGVARAYGMRRSGERLLVDVNGASDITASVSPVDVSANGRPVRIGGDGGGRVLEGDLAELVAVDGSLADADLACLGRYFRDKYGL